MSEGKLALVSLLVIAMGCSSAPPGGGGYYYAADGVGGSDGVAGADGTAGSDSGGGGATDTGGGATDTGAGKPDGGGATDTGAGKPDGGGGSGGSVPNIAPACADGTMTGEVPPTASASIQDLVAGYSAEKAYEFVLDVLDRRYPTGAFLIEQGVAKAQQNCFELFLPAALRGNVKQVIDRIEVLVHECGHLYDLSQGGFSGSHYHIFDGVTRTCSGGKHTGPNKTIARSLLNTDAYSAKRPPCKSGNKGSHGCDSYADIYLDGDPTDGKFESGDQGFALLHEETVQYVHSLATKMGMADQVIGQTSARDGILTFLWYTMRYLRLTREQYPDSYAVITGDACWREAILLTWGRAWHLLEASKSNKALGIHDAQLFELVADPDLLGEIALLRKAHGCGG